MILAPLAKQRFYDNNNNPLNKGQLFCYVAGTTTKQTTYSDSAGTPNTNPVILNYRGECDLWLDTTKTYKFVLAPANDTDPPTNAFWSVDNIAGGYGGTIDYTQIVYDQTPAELAASVTPVNTSIPNHTANGGIFLLERYVTNTTPGTTDIAAAVNNILLVAAQTNGGVIQLPPEQLAFASAVNCTVASVTFRGCGYSSINATGSANRGTTCILRTFTDASPTLTLAGDNAGFDLIDIDNDLQGTGECLKITGSRYKGGSYSTRNSGGDNHRIGTTNGGASNTNTNSWSVDYVIVTGAVGAGFRVDDTNTSTTLSYPLGVANVNGGRIGLIDARGNGSDGVQFGNANDIVADMILSQSNGECGIRFKTDGTNSGPRCIKILGNDCESNTGNDIQIDAATLPVSGPGLYNVIFGNRSVAVTSRIVDNSTGSLVIQWNSGQNIGGYNFGTDIVAVNPSGNAGVNLNAGANLAPVRLYAIASGVSDSIAKLQVHKTGTGNVDCLEVNQNGVLRPYFDLGNLAYSASMTIDASAGNWFEATCNNGTAFTINAPTNPQTGQEITVTIRNTSGGALGAATWNSVFKMSAWTNPANGNSRSIKVRYDGTNWVQTSQTGVDVPN